MIYLVTGTSSGVGYELACSLLSVGEVIGISRNLGKASVLSNNPSFSYIPFDLSALNSSDVSSSLTPLLCESLGSNEFTMVFNAAEFYSGSQRLNIDQIGSMFNVNLFSIMQLVDQLKHLNLRRILFINSVSGLVGQDNQHEYSASKHALMGYSVLL